eukprot:scaffold1736_cov127-Cylindrotheca_fusiformis.AAC.4
MKDYSNRQRFRRYGWMTLPPSHELLAVRPKLQHQETKPVNIWNQIEDSLVLVMSCWLRGRSKGQEKEREFMILSTMF